MRLTSTERTQRPVTHAVWWCWTIWTIVKHSSGVGWVQNMAIFMAKTTPRWLGCSRLDRPTWKVSSGSYHTPMHGRVCLRTILVHSRHLSRVPEMAIFIDKWLFLGQNTGRWVPPVNCLMCHITSHYMAKHLSGPFVPPQCTLMALEWSKIWLFLGQNTHIMAGWSQGG